MQRLNIVVLKALMELCVHICLCFSRYLSVGEHSSVISIEAALDEFVDASSIDLFLCRVDVEHKVVREGLVFTQQHLGFPGVTSVHTWQPSIFSFTIWGRILHGTGQERGVTNRVHHGQSTCKSLIALFRNNTGETRRMVFIMVNLRVKVWKRWERPTVN